MYGWSSLVEEVEEMMEDIEMGGLEDDDDYLLFIIL